jgi:ubiquitin carboxyl-terminal hydrolase 8
MECLTCKQTSTTFSPLQTLSLSIPPPSPSKPVISLSDCIDSFLAEEILAGENAWCVVISCLPLFLTEKRFDNFDSHRDCPRCRCPRTTSKRLAISRLPQFLFVLLYLPLPSHSIIHLKRFVTFDSFSQKVNTAVSFPLDGLELGKLLPPQSFDYALNSPHEEQTSYELYGVCSHLGDDGDGHCKLPSLPFHLFHPFSDFMRSSQTSPPSAARSGGSKSTTLS